MKSTRKKKHPKRVESRELSRNLGQIYFPLQAKMDAAKGLHNETAAELDAMLPSILDKAFKGEL